MKNLCFVRIAGLVAVSLAPLFASAQSSCQIAEPARVSETISIKSQLLRVKQRVIRMKCDNSVDSDKVETVESPRNIVELTQFPILADEKLEVIVDNRTTCKSRDKGFFPQAWPFTRYQGPLLWIDEADAMLTHHVVPGLNIIDVSVCEKTKNKDISACTPQHVVRINLDVIYEERTLNDTLVVKKTSEECQGSSKQPTSTLK